MKGSSYSSQTWKTKEMLIIPWYLCPSLGGVFSRAWSGGRRRQTLSTAQSVLLRGTVNSHRTNSSLSPSPWQSSAWDAPLLAAEAEEKLPGGFCSSGGHRDHLTVLSPKHEVAEELPEMLEEQPNTTGLVIISASVTAPAQHSRNLCRDIDFKNKDFYDLCQTS